MTHDLKKELQDARPKLKAVSPLAWWVMLIMGIFNILLGASFLLAIDAGKFTASLLIVNSVLTFPIWGMIFASIGFVKLYSLYKNNWNLARNTLLIGVAVKAAWAVALTIRTFVSPGTLFLNLIWVTLALIQMGTYIYFMPPAIASYKQRRVDRED